MEWCQHYARCYSRVSIVRGTARSWYLVQPNSYTMAGCGPDPRHSSQLVIATIHWLPPVSLGMCQDTDSLGVSICEGILLEETPPRWHV